MEKKKQVHNLIILDESGSMNSIKGTIIQGFNELVQTIKGTEGQFLEQEHFVSFITFNSLTQNVLHFMESVNNLMPIDQKSYSPNASTPLYDAMGYSINKLKRALEGQNDYNVLVTILTDGEENASKEFSRANIKNLVEDLKLKGWTFTYIGADHNVESVAFSLSINNTMVFNKNEADIKNMFTKEKKARSKFYEKVQMNLDTSSDYFDEN